jgi:hypothetical protein
MAALKRGNRTLAMTTKKLNKVQVVVIGDIYWDSVTVHTKPGLLRCDRPAGAWLLQRLLCLVNGQYTNCQFDVVGYPYPEGYEGKLSSGQEFVKLGLTTANKARLGNWPRAASRAKLYPKGSGEKPEDTKVYRVEETFGFVENLEEPEADGGGKRADAKRPSYDKINEVILQSVTNKTIVVISDDPIIKNADKDKNDKAKNRFINFRDSDIAKQIETLSQLPSSLLPSLLILSISSKITESLVLAAINRKPKLQKLTAVIISTARLRSEGHNVPSTLALETQAKDLWNERDRSPLKNLMACRHVIVHDPEGVFHFDNSEKQDEQRDKLSNFGLYCRPFIGQPEDNPHRYGGMSGYVKILIATIVKNILTPREDATGSSTETKISFDSIGEGICEGLKLWEKHFKHGFVYEQYNSEYDPEEYEPYKEDWPKSLFKKKSWHPFDRLFEASDKDNDEMKKTKIAWIRFPLPKYYDQYSPMQAVEKFDNWSRVDWFIYNTSKDIFDKMLCRVVQRGVDAIESEHYFSQSNNIEHSQKLSPKILFPVAKIGKIESIDRDEINGYIDIYKLILKYLQDKDDKKPLSLAVFGPPGTGKSSAVKKILKAARSATARAEGGEALVCNLSQLTDPRNLTAVFHQAQDRALAEEVPLVFFDEFDTSLEHPYGWLKYFLAPMEDGTFKAAEAIESYRVGKAIFAFAGGTAETFEKFQENVGEKEDVKGPDFISRLRGFLDVRSINMEDNDEPVSNLLALRRAIILNSILKDMAKEILDPSGKIAKIDEKLINAFLQIKKYRHGIRSIVAIVKMSRPEGGKLQVASLPSGPQLRMHVDDAEFLELTAVP